MALAFAQLKMGKLLIINAKILWSTLPEPGGLISLDWA